MDTDTDSVLRGAFATSAGGEEQMKEKRLYLLTSVLLFIAVIFSLYSGIRVEKTTGIADISVLTRVRYAFPGGSEETYYEYDKQGRNTFELFLNEGAPVYVHGCGYDENDRKLFDEWQHYSNEYHTSGYYLHADYSSMQSKVFYEYFADGEISGEITYSGGKVSEIRTVSYENGEKREYVEWRYPDRISTYFCYYDADGKYLKREWPDVQESYEYEYEYDDRNRVVKETEHIQLDGTNNEDIITNYTYFEDSEQKKTEITTFYYADGRASRTYYDFFDVYGNITESGNIIDGEYCPESRRMSILGKAFFRKRVKFCGKLIFNSMSMDSNPGGKI